MEFLYLIFYACLRLRFLDVETNPAPWCPMPAEYSSNVWGLAGNLSDMTVTSFQYDILLCSETLVSYASGVGVAGSLFRSPCIVVRARCLGSEGWLHTYEMVV